MNEMLSFTVERTWDLPPKVIHCWMASKLPDVGCNLRPCPCSLSCVRRPRREVSSSKMADGLHWCTLHPSRHFWLFAIVSGRFWVTITLPSGCNGSSGYWLSFSSCHGALFGDIWEPWIRQSMVDPILLSLSLLRLLLARLLLHTSPMPVLVLNTFFLHAHNIEFLISYDQALVLEWNQLIKYHLHFSRFCMGL